MEVDLLNESIAYAKELQASANAIAKLTLEETFQPTLQRIIHNKLAEDEELDDEGDFDGDVNVDVSFDGEGNEGTGEGGDGIGFDSFSDDTGGEGEGDTEEGDEDGNMELEALIRELEGEDDEIGMEEGMEDTADDPIYEEDDCDDESMYESDSTDEDDMVEAILREIDNLGDLNGPNNEDSESYTDPEPTPAERGLHLENRRLRRELKDLKSNYNNALRAITKYKSTLSELNLLNSKLMFTTKTIQESNLTESQQMKVLESFDRAKTVREVKLIYTSIIESLNKKKSNKRMSEGFASKNVKQVNPKVRKNSLNENVLNSNAVNRFQQLAGIKALDDNF